MAVTPEQVRLGRDENIAKRRIKRAAAKEGKVLTPAQIARKIRIEKQRAKTEAEAVKFKLACVAAGLPMPVREFMFAAPERNWRTDFAWPDEQVVLEVEGAVWSGGRHTRGSGYLADMEKYNELALRGYTLLRVTPQNLNKPATLELVRRALPESP